MDSGLVLEEEEGEDEDEEKERIGIRSDVIRTFEFGKWKAGKKSKSRKKERKRGKRQTLEGRGAGRRWGMQRLVVAAGRMVVEGRERWSSGGGIVSQIEFPEGRVGLWMGSHGRGGRHDRSKRGWKEDEQGENRDRKRRTGLGDGESPESGGRSVSEDDFVVLTRIVVPGLDGAGGRVGDIADDEEEGAFGEIGSVVLESDGESEPVPLGSSRRGRGRDGGGTSKGKGVERGEIAGRDLGGGLPVVEGEPDGDELLVGEVADEKGAGQTVGGAVGGARCIGDRLQQRIGVRLDGLHGDRGGEGEVDLAAGDEEGRTGDDDGGCCPQKIGRGGEFAVGLGLCVVGGETGEEAGGLCTAAEGAHGGELVCGKADVFGDVLEKGGGGGGGCAGGREGDVGRRGGGLEGGLEGLAVGEEDGGRGGAEGDGAQRGGAWRRGGGEGDGRAGGGAGVVVVVVGGEVEVVVGVVVVGETEHPGRGRHLRALSARQLLSRRRARSEIRRRPSRQHVTQFGTAQRSLPLPLPPPPPALLPVPAAVSRSQCHMHRSNPQLCRPSYQTGS